MKEYTADQVADWFLSRSSMSPKKLQKLTYYAQAWSNALLKGPLINANFEAWPHGPVCPQLYGEYKKYGWTDIPQKDDNSSCFDNKVLSLLKSVWLTYGDKEADELEALTHRELPWQNARVGLSPNDHSNNTISNDDMHNFYLAIYSGD